MGREEGEGDNATRTRIYHHPERWTRRPERRGVRCPALHMNQSPCKPRVPGQGMKTLSLTTAFMYSHIDHPFEVAHATCYRLFNRQRKVSVRMRRVVL